MKDQLVSAFHGLNNKRDPLRLGLPWLTSASNVLVTDSGGIKRRPGFKLKQTCAAVSAYASRDEQRLYVQVEGAIAEWDGQALQERTDWPGTQPAQWAEFNEDVYVSDGQSAAVLRADGQVWPWRWPAPPAPVLSALDGALPAGQYQACFTVLLPDGRETGAGELATIVLRQGQSLRIQADAMPREGALLLYLAAADSAVFQLAGVVDAQGMLWDQGAHALGRELTEQASMPLPECVGALTFWRGRAFASLHLPQSQQSAVLFSRPLAPHLWRLDSDFFMVPGEVLALAGHEAGGVVVLTDRAIYAYDSEGLRRLANYGGVAGQSWAVDQEHPNQRLLLWTQRGLCQFPEFTNLTERAVSLPPGQSAALGVVHHAGQMHLMAALMGESLAFNPFTQEDDDL